MTAPSRNPDFVPTLRSTLQSRKVRALTPLSRGLFLSLILAVDDHGLFYADARVVHSQLFAPLHDTDHPWTVAEVKQGLDELEEGGLVTTHAIPEGQVMRIVKHVTSWQHMNPDQKRYRGPKTAFPSTYTERPWEVAEGAPTLSFKAPSAAPIAGVRTPYVQCIAASHARGDESIPTGDTRSVGERSAALPSGRRLPASFRPSTKPHDQ